MSDFDYNELLEGLPDEQAEQLRDAASVIFAGLDQVRSELKLPWNKITAKRMRALSERLAVETVDYTAMEGLLVGTWMAASSRTQLKQAQ